MYKKRLHIVNKFFSLTNPIWTIVVIKIKMMYVKMLNFDRVTPNFPFSIRISWVNLNLLKVNKNMENLIFESKNY